MNAVLMYKNSFLLLHFYEIRYTAIDKVSGILRNVLHMASKCVRLNLRKL